MYTGLDRQLYRCLVELANVYGPGEDPAIIPLTQSIWWTWSGEPGRPSPSPAKLNEQEALELQRTG